MLTSMMTVDQLRALALAGGGFHLNTLGRTPDDLRAIAIAAASGGARITISNTALLSVDQMRSIALGGKGAVVFLD